MVRRQASIRETRSVVKAVGLGLAVFLLTGSASVGAQKGAAAPAAQPAVASQAASSPVARAEVMKTPPSDYTVSPEDLLDIQVLDVPEITREYRVSSNGFITLPLLQDPIPAAGETLNQLSHLIAAKFHDAGMLNNAQVTVSLRETRLNMVLVSGEVRNPQSYPVYGPTRLFDILVKAGGLTEGAGDDAIVVRGDVGARADMAESVRAGALDPPATGQSISLNIRKLVATGDDKTNILLYPGDRVTVQRAALIYILGAVAHPGGYVLGEARQQITVLKALAMAGDVTNVAKRNRITLLRRDPAAPEDSLKRNEIPVDYKAMAKGQIADMRMSPDDILFVPENGTVKAWRTTVSSAVSMVTYAGSALIVYH